MKKREGVVNINFFKKIWYSITKFEQYPAMATEGLPRAVRYLIILTSIVSLFAMIGSLLETKNLVVNLAQYIQENIPEFTYENDKLTMQSEEPMIIDDIQYIGIDRIAINTKLESDEEKEIYKTENAKTGVTVFLFNDGIVLKAKTDDNQTAEEKYTYSQFIQNYTGENIEKFNKSELVNFITSEKMSIFYLRYGLTLFIYILIMNIIYALLDTFEIAILGWLTASIAKIKIRFVAIYNMAVYSITLSIFLNILYIVINYFTNFTITYFRVAYIAIAYIYLAATIFILKDDLNKKMQEVEKIREEQKNVKEEIDEQEKKQEDKKPEEKKKDKKENKEKKEDEEGEEPQGSEA